MAALTKARPTSVRYVTYDMLPIAANAVCIKGGRVAINAAGFYKPASGVDGEVILNAIFEESKTGSGVNGAVKVNVRFLTERVLLLQNNDTGTAVVITDRGKPCYQLDDQTVTGDDADLTSTAGIVYDVTSEGVWVDVTEPIVRLPEAP